MKNESDWVEQTESVYKIIRAIIFAKFLLHIGSLKMLIESNNSHCSSSEFVSIYFEIYL